MIRAAVLFTVLAAPVAGQEAISCILRPVHEISVVPPVAGILESVAVDRGDRVEQGQVLARLVSRVEEAQLAAARQRAQSTATVQARRAQLDDAERRLAQVRALTGRGIAAQNQLDEVMMEAEVARSLLTEAEDLRLSAELEVAAAQAVVDLRSIRAPVAGIVLARLADPGEYAAADRPLLDMVTVDVLLAEVLMPAAAYGRIALGQGAAVQAEGALAQQGVVDAIDPVINAASRSFGLRLRIDNAAGALTAGTRCTVAF